MFFLERLKTNRAAKIRRKQAEIDALKSDVEEARRLMPAIGTKCTASSDCHRVRIAGRAAAMAKVEGISLREIGTDAEEVYTLTRYYSDEMIRGRKRTAHH